MPTFSTFLPMESNFRTGVSERAARNERNEKEREREREVETKRRKRFLKKMAAFRSEKLGLPSFK